MLNNKLCSTCRRREPRPNRKTCQACATRLAGYVLDPVHREKINARSRAWYYANHKKSLKRNKEWWKAHPEKQQLKRRRRSLRTYGITISEFNEMLVSQNGCCAICGSDQPGKLGFHVDHDHETGLNRGLLCSPCNVGIGMFKESVRLLRAAESYLLRDLSIEIAA